LADIEARPTTKDRASRRFGGRVVPPTWARVMMDLDEFEFDEEYYRARYPDVLARGWSSGREHFIKHGRAEGRVGAPPKTAGSGAEGAAAAWDRVLYRQHNDGRFLAPADLTVSEARPRRVLMIGSCLMAAWDLHGQRRPAGTEADLLLINNLATLPDWPPEQIKSYDLQLVQLPLRTIFQDEALWSLSLDDKVGYASRLQRAQQLLEHQLARQLAWTREHGLLTFVTNFWAPLKNPNGSLLPVYDLSNPQYFIQKINEHLEQKVREYSNAYILDIDQIAAAIGRRGLQDDAILHLAHGGFMPHHGQVDTRIDPLLEMTAYYELATPARFSDAIWAEAVSMYRTVRQVDQVKLVVVDLDDTLWNGVSGDLTDIDQQMIEGWPLGLIEALMYLKKRGLLLAICSRNEESRIRDIWPRIFGPRMSLDDFAAVSINWRPKTESMREILETANLMPRSVVFIDDNPAERAAMQQAFPDMRVLGRHPYYLRRILLWSSETQVVSVTAESARRTQMVQAQLEREGQRRVMAREDFLAEAAPRMALFEIDSVGHPRFPRCLELINKTNQYNTTGGRLGLEAAAGLFARGGRFHAFEVADAFTNYGLVGVVVTRDAAIEQWVMSCRVLGYDIESAVMAQVVRTLRRDGAEDITASLVTTDANFPCRDLFAKNGFTETGEGLWRLSNAVDPVRPEHVQID
jgi:FkbH-like protein